MKEKAPVIIARVLAAKQGANENIWMTYTILIYCKCSVSKLAT